MTTGSAASKGHALVTGGAGFIGTNLVARLLRDGHDVVVLDDFSRRGVEQNAAWLSSFAPGSGSLRVVRDDCRNRERVRELVAGANQVFHFAAQVAVTTSLTDPVNDFDVNARGTLNVLEAVRARSEPVPLVFTSTNKVYGALPELELELDGTRYVPRDERLREGVDESHPLDFHSPYGCSKGAADQYVIDYARSFGLTNVVFRMSCIYGPHQCGNEDQGWVAHFLMRALAGEPITIYGDGKQVRDVLFAEDLVTALLLARDRAFELAGQAFNIGGGAENTVSLLELLRTLEALVGRKPELRFEPARVGDQKYYVSDTGKFRRATGWVPKVSVAEGLARLHAWFSESSVQRQRLRVDGDGARNAVPVASSLEVR